MSEIGTPPKAAGEIERRLATILCADIAGYSRLMSENEERTVRVFRGHRDIFVSLVKQHRGRIFNTAGDALLAEFPSAVEAVRCATDIQSALRTRNEHLHPEERMQFRIGVNLGDVIVQGDDLLGDGVNVAARIQQSTEPGGICISGSVHEQIQNKLSLDFKLLGELSYKNIAKPIRTYTINEGAAVTKASAKRASWAVAIASIVVAALAAAGYWGYRQVESQRAERARIEAELAAQKQAAGEAQREVEGAKREAQRIAEEAKRTAEESRREAQLAAQKQAADEALRRAQEERGRVEQERKLVEAEKRAAADAAKKQALPAAAPPPAPARTAKFDGAYAGELCNTFEHRLPVCWSLALTVRDGVAEGSWTSRSKKTATARGTIAADGTFRLSLTAWTPKGDPADALLEGRLADGVLRASGKWNDRIAVAGEWRRHAVAAAPAVAAATPSPQAARGTARYDGTYNGKICNEPKAQSPRCWGVQFVARAGRLEARWISGNTDKTSTAEGTVSDQGAIDLRIHAWNKRGNATVALLRGQFEGDAFKLSGVWPDGTPVNGAWRRAANGNGTH